MFKKKLNDSAWTVKVKIRTRKKFLAVDEMCGRERERKRETETETEREIKTRRYKYTNAIQ